MPVSPTGRHRAPSEPGAPGFRPLVGTALLGGRLVARQGRGRPQASSYRGPQGERSEAQAGVGQDPSTCSPALSFGPKVLTPL